MNTHATVPESQPTSSSIGLSQVQHSKKKIFSMLHVKIIQT